MCAAEENFGSEDTGSLLASRLTSSVVSNSMTPKWMWQPDNWQKEAELMKSRNQLDDSLHAYDKALEGYGIGSELKAQEPDWKKRDVVLNKIDLSKPSDPNDLNAAMERNNVGYILKRKAEIYKSRGDNEKALDCVNSVLTGPSDKYAESIGTSDKFDMLTEKADLLKKLGRTAEAEDVLKEAAKHKPASKATRSSSDLLLIICAISGIFLLFRKNRP